MVNIHRKAKMIIQEVKLSKEKHQQNLEIMIKGNLLLKQCAALTGMTNIDFRAKLFKNISNPSVWLPEHAETIQNAIPYINAVRAIEMEMLQAYSKLAYKKAREWHKYNKEELAFADYYQESIFALLDSIYSYDRYEAKFVTFAWWSMQNRLSQMTSKSRLLSPLTAEAVILVNKFNLEKNNVSGPTTDYEIYEKLKLTSDEIKVLEKAMVKVVLPDLSNTSDKNNYDAEHDYTAMRRVAFDKPEDNSTDLIEKTEEISKIKKAIVKAGLNDLEKRILESYMDKPRGFSEKIESLNPHTNKPYSRMGLHNMLKKALYKVKTAYQKVA